MARIQSLKFQFSLQILCNSGVRNIRERFLRDHVYLYSEHLGWVAGPLNSERRNTSTASFFARNLSIHHLRPRVAGPLLRSRQFAAGKSERLGDEEHRDCSTGSQLIQEDTSGSLDGDTESAEGSEEQERGVDEDRNVDIEEEEDEDSIVPSKRSNINLPSGTQVKVKIVEFIKSSTEASQCPKDNKPEFAVIGRSNVGKSSLINLLVNRKEMAMTSKKPGKTQMINHFLINKSWYLVDLPGYGFANAPKTARADWNEFTKNFFVNRESLVSVLLLVDASIPPLQIDLECADWLGSNKIPVTVVFTKCDRRKKKKKGGKSPYENVADFESKLKEIYSEAPPWIMTSSVTRMGRDDLLLHIAQLRTFWAAEG